MVFPIPFVPTSAIFCPRSIEKFNGLDNGSSYPCLLYTSTFAVGKSLGEKAFPGQVLTLTGDLGVGKTVFTQGLAEGLGIEEPVNSPTFTIVQVYEEGRLPFYHFDVYRIGDIEEMDEVGFEEYVMGEGVSLIEWANLIEEILPERRTNILIEKDLTQGFDYRRITIEEQ